jgi:hypothetical protein
MSKHTEGRWVRPAWPDMQPPVIAEQANGTFFICETRGCVRDSRANASLIAAAPDLLEACKLALKDLEAEMVWGNVRDALVAAISKAEGQ